MTAKERVLESLEDLDLTKQEISERTGLSYKYVARLVNELVASGDVVTTGELTDSGAEIFGIPFPVASESECACGKCNCET